MGMRKSNSIKRKQCNETTGSLIIIFASSRYQPPLRCPLLEKKVALDMKWNASRLSLNVATLWPDNLKILATQ